ncbi:MAG: putative prokaryotic signal transducing protein [Verrucomicrobiota bacterium]|jgi:hypothetical protein
MNPNTVFTSFSSADAQLVASRLEAAGFHPFVENEFSAAALGGMSNSTLIRVQISDAELADAREFLVAPVA